MNSPQPWKEQLKGFKKIIRPFTFVYLLLHLRLQNAIDLFLSDQIIFCVPKNPYAFDKRTTIWGLCNSKWAIYIRNETKCLYCAHQVGFVSMFTCCS